MSNEVWTQWRGGNTNYKGPPAKNRGDFIDRLEDKPLPPEADPMESAKYIMNWFSGDDQTDQNLKKLVDEYNAIAKLRRKVIHSLTYKRGKRRDRDLPGDLRLIKDMTSKAKASYKDLEKKGLRPLKFPAVFNIPLEASTHYSKK